MTASRTLFITGTDTEVGKTYVTCALLKRLQAKGLTALGLKPVASGCREEGDHLVNGDGLALLNSSSGSVDYDTVNPIRIREAVAPHLVAERLGWNLSVDELIQRTQRGRDITTDITLIEGFGGWLAPLNRRETMAQLVTALNLDVLLVVGLRVGCINHAQLTAQAIQQSGLKLCGWIANVLQDDSVYEAQTIDTIQGFLSVPYLGEVAFGGTADSLNLDPILHQQNL